MTLSQRIYKAARLAWPIYVANDRKWGARETHDHRVPDMGQIAMTIRRLYENVVANGGGSSSSGRLCVSMDPDDGEILVDVELGVLRDGDDRWKTGLDPADLYLGHEEIDFRSRYARYGGPDS